MAESEDHRHQRDVVIVKGIATEVLQGSHSGDLLHIHRDVEKGIDKREVKGTGPGIGPETNLNGRIAIVESILRADTLMVIEDPLHLPEKNTLCPFHRNSLEDLPHNSLLALKMTLMEIS